MSLRERLTIVLHQTRSPDNLGAVARILSNFDFATLILSDPVTSAYADAERMAIRSTHILSSMRVTPTLPEALVDVVYAVGSTMRDDVVHRSALTPEQAVERLEQESARGRVALVFGGEMRGLSDEDLSHCSDLVVIPTGTTQPSMNLAQSVAVLAYLCSRVNPPRQIAAVQEEGARLGTLQALEKRMQDALLKSTFLNPQAPQHVLTELVQSLMRARLTQREAELWLSAFKHLAR
jgi:tRNA/rRNA methyltransferase